MKGRIIDQQAVVYSQPDRMSQPLGQIKAGTEIEMETTRKVGEETWIQVKGASGQPGYIPASTRIFVVKQATLSQPSVDAYAEPVGGGQPARQYPEGTVFTLLDTTNQDGMTWLKVRDALGNETYIDGGTRLTDGAVAPAMSASPGEIAERKIKSGAKEAAQGRMIMGLLWLVGGVVLTCVTNGLGIGILFYGAIVYGSILVIGGAIQYFTAKD